MPAAPFTHLGELDVASFLRDYWQQQPLLIRQAIPQFNSHLSADELAGLSLEDAVESRLVLEHGASPWELRQGPFAESDFSTLPASHWTLLLQAVDHYIPEVAELLDRFRFVPNWRLDDVMISYASRGGSVGPHFDQYDVFLLQASGQREWRLGQPCDHLSPCRSDTPLHILSEFDERERFILNPGDMLYLPPQQAHWGIALDDDCITYSIGFRAPSQAAILEELLQERLLQLSEDNRFVDPGLTLQSAPGQINPAALEQVRQIWQQALASIDLERWFGEYMTQPKYPAESDDDSEPAPDWQAEDTLERHPASRFAYWQQPTDCLLFVDGTAFTVSNELARLLGNQSQFNGDQLSAAICSNEDAEVVSQLLAGERLVLTE